MNNEEFQILIMNEALNNLIEEATIPEIKQGLQKVLKELEKVQELVLSSY